VSTRTQRLADEAREQLRERLRVITGRVLAEVRITSVRWDDGLRWCVVTLAVDPRSPARRREVPVPSGRDHHDIAILLRDAFPHARWDIAQDYDVTFGVLTEHSTAIPAALLGGDAL